MILKTIIDFFITFVVEVIKRTKKIILSMISLSFLSWSLLLYLWGQGKIEIQSTEFLLFTACVMGIKTYKKLKEKEITNNGGI